MSADEKKRTWIWVATAMITAERQQLLIELILMEVSAAELKAALGLLGGIAEMQRERKSI